MSEPQSQPTILVKKSDGTFGRMTLDEVKKMQKTSAPGSVAPPSALTSQISSVKSQIGANTQNPKAIAKERIDQQTTSPAPQSVMQILKGGKPSSTESVSPVVTAAPGDFATPLEDLPASSSPAPRTVMTREDQAEAMVGKLSFAVAPEVRNRLRTAIQLRLKDVRTDDQTKGVLMRPVKDGGVGLTKGQAEEVIQKLESGNRKFTPKADQPMAETRDARPHPFLPLLKEEAAKASPPPKEEGTRGEVSESSENKKTDQTPFKLASEPQPRAAVHDVLPPVEREVGPIGEIRLVTLTDFRRLSTNPKEAARRLRQKFTNLKEESILLYLDGLSAWRASPLYQAYVATVASALAKKQTLSAAVGDKNSIQLPEIQAVVEMENTLEYL